MLTDSTATLSTDADYARNLGLGPLVDLIEARGLEVGHVDARPVNLIDDRGRVCSRGITVRMEVDSGAVVVKVDGFGTDQISVSWHRGPGAELKPGTLAMVDAVRAGWARGGIQRALAAI